MTRKTMPMLLKRMTMKRMFGMERDGDEEGDEDYDEDQVAFVDEE